MTIKHLRILVAVAECGSISQAAGRLYLSQPTVSQIVAELEQYCGARLFDRLSRRLYPTPACRELVAKAVPVLAAFDRLDRSMQATLGRVTKYAGIVFVVVTLAVYFIASAA